MEKEISKKYLKLILVDLYDLLENNNLKEVENYIRLIIREDFKVKREVENYLKVLDRINNLENI